MRRSETGYVWTLASVLVVGALHVTPVGIAGQGTESVDPLRDAVTLAESWLEAERAFKDIPGISVGVVHDQELVWSAGFGHADPELGTPASPSTLYSICSISKLFTSTAIMQLRDQGKLRLSDPVGDHLEWFDIQEVYPEMGPVTVEGLLTHSSGLPRESDHPYWSGPDHPFPTSEEIRANLGGQETLYPARERFQYSNLGMTLAGEIVSAVSGQPYSGYVQSNVLDPLGLADTYPELADARATGRLAAGFSGRFRDGSRDRVADYAVAGVGPAAGFASNVADLATFASWQFRLLENRGVEILDSNTLREMHRVHWVNPDWETTWGLGFYVARTGDHTFVGHGGSCPGYRTQLLLQPDSKIAVVFMTNTTGISPRPYTQRLFEIFHPALSADKADEIRVAESDDVRAPTLAPAQDAIDRVTGRYQGSWGGDSEVLRWKEGIAVVSYPTDQPLRSLTRLKHVEGLTFRRVRKDDGLGEEWTFETDETGAVTRMWRNNNYSIRVES